MVIEAIVSITVILTGSSCAAIDNETNKMVWDSPDTPLVSTTYSDYGDFLLPDARYPNDTNALLALIHAEEDLQKGPAGRKIPMRCFKDLDGVPHDQGSNALDHDHT